MTPYALAGDRPSLTAPDDGDSGGVPIAERLTFGSLFAGIGGFDLGLERAGMECRWQVEINPYATRVLAKHWPNVRRHDDICTFPAGDPAHWRVDCVVGGFPCQDISYAGKGAGLAGERSGLFYEAMRVIREVGPRFVVLENVSALLTRGLDQVLGTLASFGFDAEWHCIPASAVGAPHRRDRVFLIGERACSNANRKRVRGSKHRSTNCTTNPDEGTPQERQRIWSHAGAMGQALAHTNGSLLEGERPAWQQEPQARLQDGQSQGRCDRAGESWATEPDVGRVAYGVSHRVDRLRGLGNAVVPQVAEWIGRQLVLTAEATK